MSSQSKQTAATPAVPVSTSIPGPVAGMNIARRVLFQSPTTRHAWAFDMLIAIAAAKALGITQFEIAVDGAAVRAQPQQQGGVWYIGGGQEGEQWQKTASEIGTCVITVFAVVIE